MKEPMLLYAAVFESSSVGTISILTSHCFTSLQLGVSDLSTRAAILHHTELTRDEGGDMTPRPPSAPSADIEPRPASRPELEPEDKLPEGEEERATPSAPPGEEAEGVSLVWSGVLVSWVVVLCW